MTGDYHETNKVALSKVTRLLRGDFNEYLDAPGVESTKTPEPKETIVAKKQAGEALQLAGMEDDTPEELVELARDYKKAQTAESKAKEKTKNKMVEILKKMHELEVKRFRLEIDGNMKWLTITDKEGLKWEKSETAPVEPD